MILALPRETLWPRWGNHFGPTWGKHYGPGGGISLALDIEPKFRNLAPHPGEQPSSAFLQIQRRYLLLEVVATGLFYLIIILWMLA